MSSFANYFLMQPQDVIAYVKEKLDFFPENAELTCEEIGDGNLNYVFRVEDLENARSVIVKQAGHTARISDDFHLSTNRIRIEADALKLEGELAPGLVPDVYLFDKTMSCCVMEDLSEFTIMRSALLNYEIFPSFAEHITSFMAETLVRTSDVVMDHKGKKMLQASFINPELCEITEDLVYTEPFYDQYKRNIVTEGNEEWVRTHLYEDKELKLEAAKLKFDFMTQGQALLHGDLHTGSIFIRRDETKVIDPEFAFYGPMGYDVGNVVANLIFAWANGRAAGQTKFQKWVEITIVEVIDLFKSKFIEVWDRCVAEPAARLEEFRDWYLQRVITDTAAVIGLELIRRVVGLAKVKDITSIEEPAARVEAERLCLTAAITFIKKRVQYQDGKDILTTLRKAEIQIGEEVR